MTFEAEYERLRCLTEKALSELFVGKAPHSGLADAMRYSLLAGGKRLRPVLVLAFCRAFGGNEESALPAACALEMLHTYSLIHDDLPAMDNDELRRGKPTNHVVFGEYTAILAGDALQAEAFGMILRAPLPAETRVLCAEYLADAAGLDGICGGQYLDMLGEGEAIDQEGLTEISSRKTASLLIAACRIGAALGGADEDGLEAASSYGAGLGIAFQIRDDMLNVLGREEEMGKPVGSDDDCGKATYMSVLGRDQCEFMVEKLTKFAVEALSPSVPDTAFLTALANVMAGRKR
jgi:geranylgeranyl diphosphate synthase type II